MTFILNGIRTNYNAIKDFLALMSAIMSVVDYLEVTKSAYCIIYILKDNFIYAILDIFNL